MIGGDHSDHCWVLAFSANVDWCTMQLEIEGGQIRQLLVWLSWRRGASSHIWISILVTSPKQADQRIMLSQRSHLLGKDFLKFHEYWWMLGLFCMILVMKSMATRKSIQFWRASLQVLDFLRSYEFCKFFLEWLRFLLIMRQLELLMFFRQYIVVHLSLL